MRVVVTTQRRFQRVALVQGTEAEQSRRYGRAPEQQRRPPAQHLSLVLQRRVIFAGKEQDR